MSKPPSGTPLNSGGTLYSNLANWYGMLEGSGGTTADGKGGNTGTLDASVTWTTDADGPLLAFSDHNVAAPIALAALIVLSDLGTNDWSVAWRGKQTVDGPRGRICGEPSTSNLIGMLGINGIQWLGQQSVPVQNAFFFSVTSFTINADYVITGVAGSNDIHAYKNGVELADSPFTLAGAPSFGMDTIGSGGQVAGSGLEGSLGYIGIWVNRALTASEAGLLYADPYAALYGSRLVLIP
jgi:hypothetical protein